MNRIQNETNKDQIVALEKRLLEAMKNSDIDALDELLHDDLLFVIPTGQTVTKQMDLANLQSGNLKIEVISSSEQEISLIHDNAIVSVVISLKGNYLDNPIDGQFKYIRTWKLFNEGWKVIGGAGIQI
ncbi:MAG: nuclear transport factor 2 family protein [Chitinophagales bacterium]|nr:nuclear transport factor 2 family protein [Chitinophagales bacterium]